MKQFDSNTLPPYSFQQEAVDSILKAFDENDKTHAVMACGTGKTRVCLWVAERLNAKRIVVFVPSLALINQLLHEWLEVTHWTDVSCMAICSDETVTKDVDIFVADPKECPFPVTTNPKEVRRYLKKKSSGVQIVFCTYHSSGVLAAGMMHCPPFDLCIFDEAHKTAGSSERAFSIALSDENVPSKKKLFVTATPLHYDVYHHDKIGENKLIYSMDSKKFYGPRAYTLTFRQAVNLGIISDYKVMIPIIVRSKLKNYPKISGEEMNEQAIALQKAIKNHEISKIITFHQSISDAGKFSHYLTYTNQLPGFTCLHVNSMMAVSHRTEEMQRFKTKKKALISNARCLTEGTNVPAVDMVAFLNRKHSKIDIIQSIGRAMRKHPGKIFGYVFFAFVC